MVSDLNQKIKNIFFEVGGKVLSLVVSETLSRDGSDFPGLGLKRYHGHG